MSFPDALTDSAVARDTTTAIDASYFSDANRATTDGGPEAGTEASWTLQLLSYRVLDAEYSDALESIVLVTDSPDRALHVFNPATAEDRRVPLPLGAVAVSVSPDGSKAAVAHDAYVTYVDLVGGAVIKTCGVASDAIDVVLAGNGWAYIFPMTDQWSEIHGIQLETCSETTNQGMSIYAGTVAKLHPTGTKIYGADRGLSPSDIERYNITNGAPEYAYDSPYHGDYPMCGNLWISNDGLRIFTACGRVFRSSDTKSEDMTYNGRLENLDGIKHLSHSSTLGKVLSIPSASSYTYPSTIDADLALRIHDYQFLTSDRTVPLPAFPGQPGTSFKAHGKFVFPRADGTRYYVIVQADTTSGLLNDYAIATLVP